MVAITDRTGWHPIRRQDRVSGQRVFHYSEHHASLFSAHQRNEAARHTHSCPTATELLQKLLEGHVRPIQTNDTWYTKKFKLIHNDIQYKLINFIIKLDRFCAKEATSNQLSEVLLVTLTFRDQGGIKNLLKMCVLRTSWAQRLSWFIPNTQILMSAVVFMTVLLVLEFKYNLGQPVDKTMAVFRDP